MSIRKRFNEAFGLEDNIEDERERFVDRVNQIIFHDIDTTYIDKFNYSKLFELLCLELGVNAHDVPQRTTYDHFGQPYSKPAAIRTLTNDGYTKTLQVLCALYPHIEYGSDDNDKEGQKGLSSRIKTVLSRCTCDIGIRWKDGLFYPSGAEELDEVLIEETVTWLNDYPKERKDYQRALECYSEGQSFPDVVKNCYLAAEGVAREILDNTRTLDNNKESLLKSRATASNRATASKSPISSVDIFHPSLLCVVLF